MLELWRRRPPCFQCPSPPGKQANEFSDESGWGSDEPEGEGFDLGFFAEALVDENAVNNDNNIQHENTESMRKKKKKSSVRFCDDFEKDKNEACLEACCGQWAPIHEVMTEPKCLGYIPEEDNNEQG